MGYFHRKIRNYLNGQWTDEEIAQAIRIAQQRWQHVHPQNRKGQNEPIVWGSLRFLLEKLDPREEPWESLYKRACREWDRAKGVSS